MSRPLVVVGDVLLDVDILTRADRLVPGAAAPVLEVIERRYRAGGAALAACLAARGSTRPVVLVAPLASDRAARRLRAALSERIEFIAIPCHGRTPVKTRLRARGQTIARLDEGSGRLQFAELPGDVERALRGAAAVLVADYGRGATTDGPLRMLLAECATGVPVVWDPHPRGGPPVRGVAIATPNANEAAAATDRVTGQGIAAERRRAEALAARWQAHSVAITLGSGGALLSFGSGSDGGVAVMPAPARVSGDTCGAGDCFAATAAVALAEGAPPSEAVALAVDAATRFVASGAASGIDAEGNPLDGRYEQRGAEDVVRAVRASGGTVVATGGCFDLLHAGHVSTLEAARSLGDCLVVCLNSDASVHRLKGAHRPLQPAADRAGVLAAMRAVDAVVIFDEDTPERTLQELRPDVWVKGGDYAANELPEAGLLREWGGEVVSVPYVSGRSTSGLVGLARR